MSTIVCSDEYTWSPKFSPGWVLLGIGSILLMQ